MAVMEPYATRALEALNDALDEDAGDLASRQALADLLEDFGRYEEAAGQRWLIAEGKWPTFRYADDSGPCFEPERPWDWWCEDQSDPVSPPPHATLTPNLFRVWDDEKYTSHRYATRTEAERALTSRARELGLLETDE